MTHENANQSAQRVRYTGCVQGVGFRATAMSIARSFAVAGWVRNRPDGSVELWAEGETVEVDRFLQAIRDHWGDAIDGEECEKQEPSGHERFEVRR